MRGRSVEAILDANKKVDRAFRAGALALGAKVEIETLPGYMPMGATPRWPTLQGQRRRAVGAEHYREIGHRTGSTDMGDLGMVMPILHPYMGGATGSGHGADYQIVDQALAYLGTAKALASMVVDLMADGAAGAREVLKSARPPMTREQYLTFQRGIARREACTRAERLSARVRQDRDRFPAAHRLPHCRDRRDRLPCGRRRPGRRRARHGAPPRRPRGEGARRRVHDLQSRPDPGAGARPGPGVLRSPADVVARADRAPAWPSSAPTSAPSTTSLRAILTIGGALGWAGGARRWCRTCGTRSARCREYSSGWPDRPRVYFEEWMDPLIAGIRWVSELIEIAGGRDIFAELRDRPQRQGAHRRRRTRSSRAIRRSSSPRGAASRSTPRDQARPGWGAISAVRTGQIHEIDGDDILSPGPSLCTESAHSRDNSDAFSRALVASSRAQLATK